MSSAFVSRLSTAALAGVVIAAIGCASMHMKRFIDKDVRYVVIEDGIPENVFDMPDGLRAFQFRWGGGTFAVPKTTTTNGQLQLIGNQAWFNQEKIESGGFVVNSPGCLITYVARWDADRKGWIVKEIAYPHRLVC